MNLLILSDLTPPVKIGQKLENLFMISDYILFNLKGSPNFQNSFNKRDQILKFNVLDLYDFLNQYSISKFIISVANNHILDNGIENFNKFIKFLNDKDIKFVGDKIILPLKLETI